jgi:hypothetical protein
MDTFDHYKDKKLKPASQVRLLSPRCCGNCRHSLIINGFYLCRREGGWEGDAGNMEQWYHTCEGFAPHVRNKEETQAGESWA